MGKSHNLNHRWFAQPLQRLSTRWLLPAGLFLRRHEGDHSPPGENQWPGRRWLSPSCRRESPCVSSRNSTTEDSTQLSNSPSGWKTFSIASSTNAGGTKSPTNQSGDLFRRCQQTSSSPPHPPSLPPTARTPTLPARVSPRQAHRCPRMALAGVDSRHLQYATANNPADKWRPVAAGVT